MDKSVLMKGTYRRILAADSAESFGVAAFQSNWQFDSSEGEKSHITVYRLDVYQSKTCVYCLD